MGKNKDFTSVLNEEIQNFSNLNEEQQTEKNAEIISQLIDYVPNPENESEWNKFVESLKELNTQGETFEEQFMNFMNSCEKNPELLIKLMALNALVMDASTIEELAKELAPKTVSAVSKDDLNAVQTEDEQKQAQKWKDELSSLPIE